MIRRRSPSYDLPSHRRGAHSGVLLYQERGRRSRRLLVLGIVVVAGVILSLFFPYGPKVSLPAPGGSAPPTVPAVTGLLAAGTGTGRALDISAPITLSWKPGTAKLYRVQVSRMPDIHFAHPVVTTIVSAALYYLHLDAPGTYLWRVQGQVHRRWGLYSVTHSLRAVLSLARPMVLAPHSGAVAVSPVTFCWSPVTGATGFILRITGRLAVRARATCARLTLKPGSYTWRVAAVGGPLSSGQHLTVRSLMPVRHVVSHHPARPTARPASSPVTAPVPPVPTVVPYVAPTTAPVVIQPAPTPAPVTAPAQTRPTPAPAPTARPAGGTKGCIPMFTC